MRAALSPSKREVALDLGAQVADPLGDGLLRVERALGGRPRDRRSGRSIRRPAPGAVPGELEAAHGEQLHQIAQVQTRRRRVEAAVEGDRRARRAAPSELAASVDTCTRPRQTISSQTSGNDGSLRWFDERLGCGHRVRLAGRSGPICSRNGRFGCVVDDLVAPRPHPRRHHRGRDRLRRVLEQRLVGFQLEFVGFVDIPRCRCVLVRVHGRRLHAGEGCGRLRDPAHGRDPRRRLPRHRPEPRHHPEHPGEIRGRRHSGAGAIGDRRERRPRALHHRFERRVRQRHHRHRRIRARSDDVRDRATTSAT